MRCAFFQWRIRTLRYFLYNLCTSKQNLSGFFAVSGSQYRSDQIVRNIPWTIRNYPSGTTGNNRVYPQQWRPFLIHQGIWRENQFCLDHALFHLMRSHHVRFKFSIKDIFGNISWIRCRFSTTIIPMLYI